jgi:lycopene cyclase domain-containing protein
MNEHLYYLAIDLGCVLVPLVASFHPKIKFYRLWAVFIPAMLLVSAAFLIWDIAFTYYGVWGFNGRFLLGRYLFYLPLEEWLFFFCIPYSCTFTFHCIELFRQERRSGKFWFQMNSTLAVILLIVALIFPTHIYTSLTFILLALLLGYHSWKRTTFLSSFYISFALNLLPFLISNGLLTGSQLPEPIVWYNNQYNLDIRIGTIPVEDVFYGMLFQLGTITLMNTRSN